MKKELFIGRNEVNLYGEVISPIELLTETDDENIYVFDIQVDRLEDSKRGPDIIECRISNLNPDENLDGLLHIKGSFRSQNNDGVILYVSVDEIEHISNYPNKAGRNTITIEGVLCKKPIIRKTPRGLNICDFIIANNLGESNYLNAIAWDKNAKMVASKKVGTKFKILGYIQTRDIKKKHDNDIVYKRVTELNCNEVKVIKE